MMKSDNPLMRKLLSFLIVLALIFGAAANSFAGGMLLLGVGGGGGGSLPLDGITTGIKAAYSTRQLLTAYAGPAMQVTRASDSTTSNIGFSANVLNTSALSTFCAGTTCTVTTWFDQSGGGNNMTATAAAPVIFASGAVTAINTKPAVSFTAASSQFLNNSTLSANPVNTLYQNAVVSLNNIGGNQSIAGPSGVQALYWRGDTGGILDLENAAVGAIGTSSNAVTANVGAVVEAQYNSTTGAFSFFINRASGGTGSSAQTLSAAHLQLGSFDNSNEKYDGLIGEYIAYDLVGGIPTASQTSIENNQKAFWGTP